MNTLPVDDKASGSKSASITQRKPRKAAVEARDVLLGRELLLFFSPQLSESSHCEELFLYLSHDTD